MRLNILSAITIEVFAKSNDGIFGIGCDSCFDEPAPDEIQTPPPVDEELTPDTIVISPPVFANAVAPVFATVNVAKVEPS